MLAMLSLRTMVSKSISILSSCAGSNFFQFSALAEAWRPLCFDLLCTAEWLPVCRVCQSLEVRRSRSEAFKQRFYEMDVMA
jgi:hypothetical protein